MNEAIAAARDMSLSAYLDMCNISKQGQWYVCPFCGSGTKDNKTSAFRIYHDKRFCCHSCQEKGGLIDFVMKINKVGFKDAIRILGVGDTPKGRISIPRAVYVQIRWCVCYAFLIDEVLHLIRNEDAYIHMDYPYTENSRFWYGELVESSIEWYIKFGKEHGHTIKYLGHYLFPNFIEAKKLVKKVTGMSRKKICNFELVFPYSTLNLCVSGYQFDMSQVMHIVNEIFADGGYYDVSHEDWPVLVYYLTRFFPPNTFNMQPPEAYN